MIQTDQQFTIQPASIDDVQGIGAAQLLSWHQTYPNEQLGITSDWIQDQVGFLEGESADEYRRNQVIEAQANPERMLYLVVKNIQGSVVGFLHVTKGQELAHFDAVYLTDQATGQGVGQRLMDKALEFAGDLPMDVQVTTYNQRAIQFYEKNGFVKDHDIPELYRGKMPLMLMKRPSGKAGQKETQ